MCRDDVAVRRSVRRVRRDWREGGRAVGVVQDMGCVGEVRHRYGSAAVGLTRGRFGDGRDVGRDERKRGVAAVVDVGSEDHKVRVMAELRIVGNVGAGRARVTAPAACEVGWIRGLRPTKQEIGVRQIRIEGDRSVQPPVPLGVPLDLGITGGQAGGRTCEGPEVGRAHQCEIAPVIHTDQLIDHLHVSGGTDRPRGVGGCRLESLVGGGQAGTVQPVERRRRVGGGCLG